MSAQEILAELPRLSQEEREQVAQALQDLTTGDGLAEPQPLGGTRVAGMHAGAWEIAPDFDEPLPDEFWFGKDA